MTGAEFAIDVHELSKAYNGKTVVDRFSLRVPRGKIYGFLGPNGSGKTTTIRMICGLLTPDSGKGTCLGYDLHKGFENIKRRTGYMTQKFSFWEDLTIEENLMFVADMFGLNNAETRVQQALENLNLTARRNQLAGGLSGGWKQRLALAACVLHEPELLLLDEPTAGVDPQARREFWDQIHELAAKGLTVLVSTHYMDEAERCHAIIYLAEGRLIAEGTVAEVIDTAGLTAWSVEGADLTAMMESLRAHPAVATAAVFGETVHISGSDPVALKELLAQYPASKGYVWSQASPTLEDAFIHFVSALPRKN